MLILNFESMIPITKGWSSDKKYCVTLTDGKMYLLRISPIEQLNRKRIEFETIQRVVSLGVPMCQPIEFGVCGEGVYSLQSWINGKDAEEKLPFLSIIEQYTYGLEAGLILKQFHSLPVLSKQEDWENRFNRKIDQKIQMYNDCPIKYENGQAFLDYFNANRQLLKNRPQCFQHGDYHIGNMMIDNDGKLQIIDFDRYDYGDPWEEFNRIVLSAQKAPMFASGMVNGYFDNNVPFSFWQILALYISCNTISSIPWAIPFGQIEIDTMINLAVEVLNWFDNMKNPVPTWYKSI